MPFAEPDKILIIDDDTNFVFAFKKIFEESNYWVVSAHDGLAGLGMVHKEQPSVIFMDISMPKMNGLDVLATLKEKKVEIPVIIMTGVGTMDTAIKAIQLGAYEYITKPLDINKVRIITKRAIETSQLKKEVDQLRTQLNHSPKKYELIGNSQEMQEIFKIIGSVTATPNLTNVLILGESGTGKELVARAIHSRGKNASEPFVGINCTALPEDLLESELFGHEKGAFTGAVGRKIGKFEAAKQGTIFLDEIGDMPVNLQQKLLRVLQEREFERLGSNNAIKIKARFIASTNKDLDEEIKAGRFRNDLFYRLNVITVVIPPLRQHKDDIPLLVEHFVAKYGIQLGRQMHPVSEEVMKAYVWYDYPGNVRELANLVERGVIMSKGKVILPHALPKELKKASSDDSFALPFNSLVLKEARQRAVEVTEKKVIIENLKATNGNVTQAAKSAQVARESFQRLMKKYQVSSKDFRSA